MNSILALLGITAWKPILSALLLPPVPFLLLIVVGARLILPRRGWGWFTLMLGVIGLWLSMCIGMGQVLTQYLLTPPLALSTEAITALKNSKSKANTAIVVLGGGADSLALEYRVANLQAPSLERLRYGLWLQRETGISVAFSGGLGWGVEQGQSEAQIAGQIASAEFGRPLKWLEDNSRDTHENATMTVGMLRKDGVHHIVLVTHASHMPRARALFEEAAAGNMTVQAAPMGLVRRHLDQALSWIPSKTGFGLVHNALHEWWGLLLGV
jgi:uncharacterized SAM-binding protein YcdF (DUF218 family)